MDQEEFKHLYDALNFQREIENMGAKEEFKRKNCAKNYISKAAFDMKLAKLYSQELSVEADLLQALQEEHTEEELSEIRHNIILRLERLREENQAILSEYMTEEENQYNSEQSNIVVVRFLRSNFSIMDNISQDFFSPRSSSSNTDRDNTSGGSSPSESEDSDDDDFIRADLGFFIMDDNIDEDFFSSTSNPSNLNTSRAYGSGGSSTSSLEERDDNLPNDIGAFVMGDFHENAS